MQKNFLSIFVRICRERLKKGCAKWSAIFLRAFSYPLFGIPCGLENVDDKIEVLYPEQKVKTSLPYSIEHKMLWCFQKEEILPADGVIFLENATGTGLGGNLLRNGKLTTTYLQPLDGKPPYEHTLFRFSSSRFFPRIFKTDEPVVTLAAGWQGAFYHWVYEVLPRFHLIEKRGHSEAHIFLEKRASFQKESLALLGIEDNKIINISDYEAVKTPLLMIPSISSLPTLWGCRFLRERFLTKVKKEKKRRIYISRKDAGRRRILNEEAVLEILAQYGFEEVILSPLSFKEQIEVFYNAEAIIGPHGAGFSHLVFCDPMTPVLEIFSPAYVNPCYWQVCNRISLAYHYLLGKGKRYPDFTNSGLDPDIEVDLEELKTSLSLMGMTC